MRAHELEEKWSEKYKRSINCNNPKGFSQRAHCAGRKKNEDVDEHIVKVKGGYELKSKHGNKNLGKYPTRAGAEKRERQVQYFKHVNESVDREELKTLHSAMADLLPIVMKELGLKNLPKIKIVRELNNDGQPSFGCFSNEGITLAITGRHPVDICRTLAHELVHYKQKLDDKLNPDSGETGSSEENEANSVAGIIMRKFSQEFPAYINNEV